MAELKAELILETKGAINSLDTFLKKSENIGQEGTKTGINYGNAVKGGILTAFSGFSLNSIFSQISSSVGAYRSVEVANLSLQGAVRATSNRQIEQQKVLSSTTSTLEQKALALGIDTSKLYENVTASKQASNATESLKNSLKIQTRALEDSIKPLERSITAKEREIEGVQGQIDILSQQENAVNRSIKNIDKESQALDAQISIITKNTNEKIKALKTNLGGNDLEKEKTQLEISKNSLEIKRDQAKLNGDNVAAKFIDIEIGLLSNSLSLNRNKLDNINLQTEAIKSQDDVAISQIETQKESLSLKKQEVQAQRDILSEQKSTLENQKQLVQNTIKTLNDDIKNRRAVFELDTEPLKRQIEDINASISNIGSGDQAKVLNQKLAKQIEEASKKSLAIAPNLKIDDAKIQGLATNLLGKFGRTLSAGDINSSISDIVQAGITDISQIETLFTRYVETASRSRVGTQNLGQAVNNLSQDFKGQISALSQQSGIAENYAELVKKGKNALIEQSLAVGDTTTAQRLQNGELTEAETRQAQYFGTLQVTNDTAGAYNDSLNKGFLAQSEFNQSVKIAEESIGKGLLPAFNSVLKALNPFILGFSDFTKNNPGVVVGVTGLAIAFGLLSFGLGLAKTAMSIFGVTSLVALGPILAPMLPILGIIAGITLAVGLLYLAWQTNFGGIQDITKKVFDSIGDFYNTNLKPTVDSIGKLFQDTLNNITQYFTDGNITWQEKLGALLGFFISLPAKVGGLMIETVINIGKAIGGYDYGNAWNALTDAGKNSWNGLVEFFRNFNYGGLFKGLGNSFIDILRGVIKGIGAGLPGADVIINPILNKLPKFATGGLISGSGTGTSDSILARVSRGEFIVNQKDTTRNLPMLRAINSGANYNQQQYDQSVTNNNYNNYSTGGFGLSVSQKYKMI